MHAIYQSDRNGVRSYLNIFYALWCIPIKYYTDTPSRALLFPSYSEAQSFIDTYTQHQPHYVYTLTPIEQEKIESSR